MTLKELMGDLERGDGRRFANNNSENWFEPIFLADETWHGKQQSGKGTVWTDYSDGWKEYLEPKKKVELWKWAYKDPNGGWRDTVTYYTKSPGPLYVRVEGSRIEVEE